MYCQVMKWQTPMGWRKCRDESYLHSYQQTQGSHLQVPFLSGFRTGPVPLPYLLLQGAEQNHLALWPVHLLPPEKPCHALILLCLHLHPKKLMQGPDFDINYRLAPNFTRLHESSPCLTIATSCLELAKSNEYSYDIFSLKS